MYVLFLFWLGPFRLKSRAGPEVRMGILLFAFWILLNGRWTAEIAVTGAAVSGMIYLLCWRLMGYSPRKEWQLICRLPRFLGYLGWLVCEIFRSGAAVIRRVWHFGSLPQPQLEAFESCLCSEAGRTALADSVTLTPGTVTVSVQGKTLLVHALDPEFADGLHDSEMEKRLKRVEGGRMHG